MAIRLTQTVQKGGCAAKVAATELRKILGTVEFPPVSTELLIDGRHFDDASVYRLTPELALVSTLDFFTPIVDTPRLFGAIAATNAISDVYAMGGRPITALGILAFPVATLPAEVITEVMQGACDSLKTARASLSGGHSIDDDTLKFGLSVSGLVHPEKIWSNQGVRPGDVLILTKGLGTGTLTAALKRDAVTELEIKEALDSMMMLNNAIDYLEPAGLTSAVHAATDLTGFGFLGHAMQLGRASQVNLEFQFSQIPVLAGALEMMKLGFLTKAHRTNREYVEAQVDWLGAPLTDEQRLLLFDPQTSGGLLLAVAPEKADAIVQALPFARRIGRATAITGIGAEASALMPPAASSAELAATSIDKLAKRARILITP